MTEKELIRPAVSLPPRAGLTALAVAVVSISAVLAFAATGGEIAFTDVRAQTRQFIDYYNASTLTPEQEAIKREALSALPAPCCSDNSAYTCCCPCNMAKSAWGLAAYLIVEERADADAVRDKVSEWFEFINPDGFSGDVCYTSGGCMKAFRDNGCGGMSDRSVTF